MATVPAVCAVETEVGEQLEQEGIDKFAASYQAVLDTIEAKRANV
jgi:hypothetical protein